MQLTVSPLSEILGRTCERAWSGLLPMIGFDFNHPSEQRLNISLMDCEWAIFQIQQGKQVKLIDSQVINTPKVESFLALFVEKKLEKVIINLSGEADELYFSDDLKVEIISLSKTDAWYIFLDHKQQFITIKNGEISIEST